MMNREGSYAHAFPDVTTHRHESFSPPPMVRVELRWWRRASDALVSAHLVQVNHGAQELDGPMTEQCGRLAQDGAATIATSRRAPQQ